MFCYSDVFLPLIIAYFSGMILVTGGTGLVGSHLLYFLAASGSNVRATHRKSSDLSRVEKVFNYYTDKKTANTLFNTIEWVQADITILLPLPLLLKIASMSIIALQ